MFLLMINDNLDTKWYKIKNYQFFAYFSGVGVINMAAVNVLIVDFLPVFISPYTLKYVQDYPLKFGTLQFS